MMLRRIAGVVLLFYFAIASGANAGPVASFDKLVQASSDWGYDEVYGSISFQLGKPFKLSGSTRVPYQNSDLAFLEAMKSLASTLNQVFGETSGSYIVTIEISKGKDIIARAPIISLTSDVTKVLFFEKSRDEFFGLTQEQTLREYIPVNQDNNKFMVKLEASHLESSSLDLGILKKLISLGGTLAGVETLPIAESAATIVTGVEGVLKDIFDTNKKDISQNSIEMAFINKDQDDRASATEIVIATKFTYNGQDYTVNLPIRVNFNIQLTRLSARVMQDGTFDGNVPTSIIELTPLIPGDNTVTLFNALRTSSNPKVRAFLDELIEKGEVKTSNAAIGCRDIYKSLAQNLTQRDQAAFYYAFTKSYQAELKSSQNGEGCMQEPMRSELTRWLKVPDGGLDILSTTKPQVAVVPVGKDGNVIHAEDVRAENVFSESETLEVPAVAPGIKAQVSSGSLPLIAVVPDTH
jgi:hypothetical protein